MDHVSHIKALKSVFKGIDINCEFDDHEDRVRILVDLAAHQKASEIYDKSWKKIHNIKGLNEYICHIKPRNLCPAGLGQFVLVYDDYLPMDHMEVGLVNRIDTYRENNHPENLPTTQFGEPYYHYFRISLNYEWDRVYSDKFVLDECYADGFMAILTPVQATRRIVQNAVRRVNERIDDHKRYAKDLRITVPHIIAQLCGLKEEKVDYLELKLPDCIDGVARRNF